MSSQEVYAIHFEVTSNLPQFTAQAEAANKIAKKFDLEQRRILQAQAKNPDFASQFANTYRSFGKEIAGAFKTDIVTAGNHIEELGKRIGNNSLKFAESKKLINDYRNEATRASSDIGRLAREEVKLRNSMVQRMRVMPDGRVQGMVVTPKTPLNEKVPEISSKIKAQEQRILADRIRAVNYEIVNQGKNLQWTGRQLMLGITLPMVIAGGATVKFFKDIDSELSRLAKVYGDLKTGGGDLMKQTMEARQMGKDLASEMAGKWGIAGKETIGLAADIAATGQEGEKLATSTREASRLMVLGEVDRQGAMATTLSLQTAFRVSSSELAGTIDYLNAVENQTSLSLEDMTVAIPKAGTVVKALGGDVKDLSLYMTAMKEGGINAEEGANALKTGLARIMSPRKASREALGAFGIDIDQIINANKGDITKVILALKAEIDKQVPQEDKAQVFEKLFGIHQYPKMLALFENLGAAGSQTVQVMELMKMGVTELAQISSQELSVLEETGTMKFQRMLESIKLKAAEIGEYILPVFNAILGVVDKAFEFFNKSPAWLKYIIGGGVALAAIMGPLIMMRGVLMNFIGNARGWYQTIKNVITGNNELNKVQWKMTTTQEVLEQKAREWTDTEAAGLAKATTAAKLYREELNRLAYTQREMLENNGTFSNKDIVRKLGGVDPVDGKKLFVTEKQLGASKKPGQFVANPNYNQWVTQPKVTPKAITQPQMVQYGSRYYKDLAAVSSGSTLFTRATTRMSGAMTAASASIVMAGKKIGAAGSAIMSKPGVRGGLGMGVLAAGAMLSTENLGAASGLASGAMMGAGAGMFFGPTGMAIGAGLGAIAGGLMQVKENADKARDALSNSMSTSSWAVQEFGIKLKSASELDFTSVKEGIAETGKVAEEAAAKFEAYKQAFNEQDETGTEKALIETMKSQDRGDAFNSLFDYARKNIALGVDPKKLEPALRAIASNAELGGLDVEVNLRLKEMNITNKEEAVKSYKDKIQEVISKSNEISQNSVAVPNAGGLQGSAGIAAQVKQNAMMAEEEMNKLSNAMSFLPLNTTTKEFNDLNSQIDWGSVNHEEFVRSLENGTEEQKRMAATIRPLTDSGFSLSQSFMIANAEINGVTASWKNLERSDDVIRKTIQINQEYNEIRDSQTSSIDAWEKKKLAALDQSSGGPKSSEAAAKAAEDRAKRIQEAGQRVADGINARAEAAQKASDKAIAAMEKRHKREEKALQNEIKRIKKREDARQKAFEAEKKRVERANELRNMEVDYRKAVDTGDFYGALKIRNNINAKKHSNSVEDKQDRSKTSAERRIEKLEARLDKMQERNKNAIDGARERAKAEQDAYKAQAEAARKSYDAQAKAAQDAAQKARESAKSGSTAYNKQANAIKAQAKSQKDAIIRAWHLISTGQYGELQKMVRQGGTQGKAAARAIKQGLKETMGGTGIQIAKVFGNEYTKYPWDQIGKLIEAKASGNKKEAAEAQKKIKQSFDLANFSFAKTPLPVKKASGGYISGPGGPTDDKIPALLSNGEYVIKASSVAKYGKSNLDSINQGTADVQKYASGGIVGRVTRALLNRYVDTKVAKVIKRRKEEIAAEKAAAEAGGIAGPLAGGAKASNSVLEAYARKMESFVGSGTINGHTVFRRCLQNVQDVWAMIGGSNAIRLAYAHQMAGVARSRGMLRPVDKSWKTKVPRGNVVIWSSAIGGGAGHIAVSDGNGNTVNNWGSATVMRARLSGQAPGAILGHADPSIFGRAPSARKKFKDGGYVGPDRKDEKGRFIDPIPSGSIPQLKKGATIKYNDTLANLHKGERVLTEPLTKKLDDGLSAIGENNGETWNMYFNIKKVDADLSEIEEKMIKIKEKRKAKMGNRKW